MSNRPKDEKIFFLHDGTYIYQWQARYFDPDDYDHHSYHILKMKR